MENLDKRREEIQSNWNKKMDKKPQSPNEK